MQHRFRHPRLNDPDWLATAYSTRTIHQIATQLSVSDTSVLRALRAYGIERRSRNVRVAPIQHPLLADRAWLVEHYAASSATGIARLIDVNAATVSRALRVHGITPHTPAETQRLRRAAPELDDADWLRRTYETRSIASIATELGVSDAAVHTAMIRLGVERRGRGETKALGRPALLDDRHALAEALETHLVTEIAAELGVAVPTVQVAMQRLGVKSPWQFNGWRRIKPPDEAALAAAWSSEETIKGVALRFEVSVNTAAIWLARIGIFISDVPVISRTDLLKAIDRGDTIDIIRRNHRIASRTVVVELHRHGLYDAHHRRHMADGTDERPTG